jgi:thiamine-phosphate pyrophosphorylase
MPGRCLLYYITDRRAFPGDETAQQRRLLEKITEATRAGVDYIQLREKDLPPSELEKLAREAVNIVRSSSQLKTALLINSRTDVALTTQADGVHLRSDDILPSEVRKIWSCGAGTPAREDSPQNPIIAVSCHSPKEVAEAARNAATFAVFAPIFEKNVSNKRDTPQIRPTGLSLLAEACRSKIPVLALGGITLENARSCLEAGAAGIAAIRLFQENDISEVVVTLRH